MKSSPHIAILLLQITLYSKMVNSAPCKCNISVGHFFKTLFSEFANNLPACVCVQMCSDHPAYCYPNGCHLGLNISAKTEVVDTRKVHRQTGPSINDPFYLVYNQKEPIYDEAPTLNLFSANKEKIDEDNESNMLNPLKKIVLKHKKPPQLAMKYNLLAKLKSNKGDETLNNLDVSSKPSWSRTYSNNKNTQFTNSRPHFSTVIRKHPSRYFLALFPDILPHLNLKPGKYFSKRESNKNDAKKMLLYDINVTSLEYNVDDFFDNSLVDKLLTSLNSSNSFLYRPHDVQNFAPINLDTVYNIKKVMKKKDFKHIFDYYTHINDSVKKPLFAATGTHRAKAPFKKVSIQYNMEDDFFNNNEDDKLIRKINSPDDTLLYQTHKEENFIPTILTTDNNMSKVKNKYNFINIFDIYTKINDTAKKPTFTELGTRGSNIPHKKAFYKYETEDDVFNNGMVDKLSMKLNSSDTFSNQIHGEQNLNRTNLTIGYNMSKALMKYNSKNIYNYTNINDTRKKQIFTESGTREPEFQNKKSFLNAKTIQIMSNEIYKHINKSLELLEHQTEAVSEVDFENTSRSFNLTDSLSENQEITTVTILELNTNIENNLKSVEPNNKDDLNKRKNRQRIANTMMLKKV